MDTNKGKHGGYRSGAGRKKREDIKKPVTYYILSSVIDAAGGKDSFKKKTKTYLENYKDE